ncbi:MAG TPA: nucleotidyltransferase domain-containing protein [Candidatus Bilamarchaeaceae archaeon]|nr:nucleotidyltransferase domain-containing protein [Candidatus Bilamarchaeaceae archaeon]
MIYRYALLRALRTVLTRPLKKFSIVQLAKEARMAPSAAKYSLDYMHANGIVLKEVVGRTHQCSANLGEPLARQWKILFSLEKIRESGLVKVILENVRGVVSIVLYGSVAEGRDDEKSDIDIIVIADSKKTAAAYQVSGIGGRELNMHFYTPAEWRRKAEKDKLFYENVVLGCIPLYGERPVMV